MTRELNKRIRADAQHLAKKLSDDELQQVIVARSKKINDLKESLAYHNAQLSGYVAAASERKKK